MAYKKLQNARYRKPAKISPRDESADRLNEATRGTLNRELAKIKKENDQLKQNYQALLRDANRDTFAKKNKTAFYKYWFNSKNIKIQQVITENVVDLKFMIS